MFHKDSCKISPYTAGQFIQEISRQGTVRRYRKQRVLGKGGFAKCYEVTDEKSQIRLACKVIDKDKLNHRQLKQKLQSEIDIHRKLLHKNIVKFQKVFQDDKYLYILLELCANNTLNELLLRRRVLSEVETRYYMFQILQALLYLQKNKIIHRDLKLDNCFLDKDLSVKIGDFGLAARMVSNKVRRTNCGTPNYMAPEIWSKHGYSYEVDIWSLGILTYLLLYGHYPFEDEKSISTKISTKTYLINPTLSDITKNFIGRMLQMNPHQRFTVKQLLNHQFLTYFDIPKSLPRSSLACPLNHDFLIQFKAKKAETAKEDEQFNFMLESRESHSSPRSRPRHSAVSQSMSASKILGLAKFQKEELPYIFSQKKVESFGFEGNLIQLKDENNVKDWVTQWWQFSQYGLLYQLNNRSFGLRFNDETILHFSGKKWIYIDAKGNRTTVKVKQLQNSPDFKIILSKIKVMKGIIDKKGLKVEDTSISEVFVKRYLHYLGMFVIWVSNGQVQCRFGDKSELIIGKAHCIYINSNKIKVSFQSKLLNDQNDEILEKQSKLSKLLKKIKAGQCQRQKENIVPN